MLDDDIIVTVNHPECHFTYMQVSELFGSSTASVMFIFTNDAFQNCSAASCPDKSPCDALTDKAISYRNQNQREHEFEYNMTCLSSGDYYQVGLLSCYTIASSTEISAICVL